MGAFWTRLGTYTGEAESGTVEEIDKFRAAGKPVLLYFSSVPVVLESVDAEQYRRLREYREKVEGVGIVFAYDSLAEFRDLLLRHLSDTIGHIHVVDTRGEAPKLESGTDGTSDAEKARRIFKSEFSAFVRRLDLEWSSERDSEPYSDEEGRAIMRNARFEILNFRAQIVKDTAGRLTTAFDEAVKKVRELERHQLYIDGGVSFTEFWKLGDSVISALKQASAVLEETP